MSRTTNHVTVVVCTYNRAELLSAALGSLQRLRTQGRFTYDILVVDNASTDATRPTVAAIAADSPVPIRYVYEGTPGVAAARNCGLAEASGEWVAFCDDDQEADENWLYELLRMADEKHLRVVGGAVKLALPQGAALPALAVRRNFGESISDQPRAYTKRNSPGTGNLLVHRSVIDQVGNFDINLRQAGEDTDLFRRIRSAGIESWYNPAAIVWHRIPAYRLTPEYQKWSSQRTGWCFADRDLKEAGRLKVLAITAARACQALLIRVPLLVLRKLQGNEQDALGVCCDLWRCEGYVRSTLHAVFPRLCSQCEFQQQLEFRGERSWFGSEAPPAAEQSESNSTAAAVLGIDRT